jgi:hypothetical protein
MSPSDLVAMTEAVGYSASLPSPHRPTPTLPPMPPQSGDCAAGSSWRWCSSSPLPDLSLMLSVFPWTRFPAGSGSWSRCPPRWQPLPSGFLQAAALKQARHLSSSMDTRCRWASSPPAASGGIHGVVAIVPCEHAQLSLVLTTSVAR